jgi:hypothetical protein
MRIVKQTMAAAGLLSALLAAGLVLKPSLSMATEKCECGEDEKTNECLPCDCDCKDEKNECIQCKFEICHNIGGPRDLGANCDGTDNCTFIVDGNEIEVPKDHFLGIIIGFKTLGPALKAHLNHGDGQILETFDPPLHLASEGQNHRAANVECFAKRLITTQPPEPGN